MTEPFFYVFRLPQEFPSEYCFGAGVPVNFQMVDWFGGPADMPVEEVNAFIRQKQYATGRLLVIERNSSECWIVDTAEESDG